ncbi:MAG TPA: SH3 domain-containing protein [Pyrinomonadaceae bacterium]|nr:SH3 domain-containing protein [Pyrinomonadaceae bacterium]
MLALKSVSSQHSPASPSHTIGRLRLAVAAPLVKVSRALREQPAFFTPLHKETRTRVTRSLKSKLAIVSLIFVACSVALDSQALAQQRRAANVGQRAVVVDERLAALRESPELSAHLLQRLNRGHKVTIVGSRQAADGITFYRVTLTKRTGGWMQSEAVISPVRKNDDERLLRLIRGSEDFDRLARAYIFLELFPRSPLRPAVLLLYAEVAEEAATKLSRDAVRRLDAHEMQAGGAPDYSYFLNYNGLDRYNRQGVSFVFDRTRKQFHYDGAAWREIVRRYPNSPEAAEARKRLDALATMLKR